MAEPLSQRLRAATERARAAGNAHPFVRRLLGGGLDAAAYAAYLANRGRVLIALETALAPPAAAAALPGLWHPALARAERIDSDLAAIRARFALPPPPALAAAQSGVAAIEALAARDPRLLAGALYALHFNLVFIGQAIALALAEGPGLPEAELATFDFEALGDLGAFVAGFRSALDELGAAEPGPADGVVSAALSSFAQARALLDALEARPGPGRG